MSKERDLLYIKMADLHLKATALIEDGRYEAAELLRDTSIILKRYLDETDDGELLADSPSAELIIAEEMLDE